MAREAPGSIARAARLTPWLALWCWMAPREALADVAPTPSYIYAPPTFLVLLVAAYVLLMVGGGLGIVVRRMLRKPVGAISQKRAVTAAAAVALVLTLFFVVFGEIASRNNRADRRARSAARSNLGAIRSTEVAYFAEWNVYVGNQPPTPIADRRGSDKKVRWDSNTRFSILGFAPEGDVVCSYALEGPPWSTEGFTARAECDYDRDGQLAIYTITSTNSEIVKSGAPF